MYLVTNLVIIHCLILVKSGLCLECFVCHEKTDRDCTDPFDENRNDTIDCKRVRDVGIGLVATANILGAAPGPYLPLSQPPHACFKINMGNFIIRGCGKPDVCQNHTGTDCFSCVDDGCNSCTALTTMNALLLSSLFLIIS